MAIASGTSGVSGASGAFGCLADETLFAFVLGQLAAESVAEVERHLSECDECRSVVAETAQSLTTGEASRSRADTERRIGRYDLVGLLGAGAYGVVYRAFDPDLRRTVALKVLRPDEHSQDPLRRERMVREAQAMAQLSHPNVVAVYDVGVHGDAIYIVMEYIAGGTVRAYLEREPRSSAEVLGVYLQAGRGLAAAHGKGLVHRDFKPENVLVGADGQVRVTDFGLARIVGGVSAPAPLVGERANAVELSTTKGVIGTPGYVAPEQFAGAAADARSDQFSFCVALFSGLYGKHPFRAGAGVSLDELAVRVCSGTVEEVPDAERVPAVHRLLMRGLRPDPNARFASMGALLQGLESALQPKTLRARHWLAALLLLGLVSAVTLYLRSQRAPVAPSSAGLASVSRPPAAADSASAVLPALTASAIAPTSVSAEVPPVVSAAIPLAKRAVRARPAPPSNGSPKPREQRYVDGLKEPF